jgi:hypothetical protein
MTHRTKQFTYINNDVDLDILQGTRHDMQNNMVECISDTLAAGQEEKCFWNENAAFSYSANANTSSLLIVSSSTSDTVGGVGAQTVKITGLQYYLNGSTHEYLEHTQTVNMNGTTDVSIDDYYRILKIQTATAGANLMNQGNIKVYDGTFIFGCMGAGQNHSNMLVVSPKTNHNMLVKTLSVSSYYQSAVELKIIVYSEVTGLEKVMYKFFMNSSSPSVNFDLDLKLVAGDTLWGIINPLETKTGTFHRASGSLKCIQKTSNSTIPQ